MDKQQAAAHPIKNLILRALPAPECHRLVPNLQWVSLPQGRIIYHAGEPIDQVYFPNSGMVSLLSISANAETLEIAMVGNEGMVGMPVVWGSVTTPYQMMVQIAGSAFVMKTALLKEEMKRQTVLHDLLLRHTHTLVGQITQSAICNRFHTVEQRLCRWLLTTHDRTKSNRFTLTQYFLSHMLGSGRQRVNAAVGSLQKKNLIRYVRGQVTILDRGALEATSCECYKLVKQVYEKSHYLTKKFFM
ncbi:MAG TPA: Crp/Fnr family transcriptional regulator [Blastocatellia bacterium]|nr:Crp/Fnr family transcriptional regulator [Blastocatellia bacterium]